jgi:hypothetical protein
VVVTLAGQVVCGRPTHEAHRPARRWWQRLVPRPRSSVEEAAGQRPVLGLIELLKESGVGSVRVERAAPSLMKSVAAQLLKGRALRQLPIQIFEAYAAVSRRPCGERIQRVHSNIRLKSRARRIRVYACVVRREGYLTQLGVPSTRYADSAAVANVDLRSDNAMKSSLSLSPTSNGAGGMRSCRRCPSHRRCRRPALPARV